MSLTSDESHLMERRETELNDSEREAIHNAFKEFDTSLRNIGINPARDDRAARLEAAMVRFILESRTMKVSDIHNWKTAAAEYSDRHVYIQAGENSTLEWEFCVTLDREDGSISDGPVCAAATPHGDYTDDHGEPPEDVKAAFLKVRPEMVKQLEAEHTAHQN